MKNIFLKNKNLIVITDQHFPNNWEVIQPFCDLLEHLDAQNTYLILLGDLFHVWFAIKKTLSLEQKRLLQVLENFQTRKGKIGFLIGNRDIFFSEKNSFFPFNDCSFQKLIFETSKGKKILFAHGNLINQQDKNYLLWRKIVHSFAMKCFVYLLPTPLLKKLTLSVEKDLKQTNQEKKQRFYKEEWLRFLSDNEDCELCVVGHFHPKKIVVEQRAKNRGIILEAWLEQPAYLIIDEHLKITHKFWKTSKPIDSNRFSKE